MKMMQLYLSKLMILARKVRNLGLLFILAGLLINTYFELFDQQTYIQLLARLSPDGVITDVDSVFFRILVFLVSLVLLWLLVTSQSSISFLKESAGLTSEVDWRYRRLTYALLCLLWLLISYLPFLFFDFETIFWLGREDSFYENCSFLWLSLASIGFLGLFFSGNLSSESNGLKVKGNMFFLLLGLLFFVGAGEEISWGQRIFNYKTPEVSSSNLQHEFNLHNSALLDLRVSTKRSADGTIKATLKKGLAAKLDAASLFIYFWCLFCILIPMMNGSSRRIHRWLDKINFPIVPIWLGFYFMFNYFFIFEVLPYLVEQVAWPAAEMQETAYSFFFFILAFWFVLQNRPDLNCLQSAKVNLSDK